MKFIKILSFQIVNQNRTFRNFNQMSAYDKYINESYLNEIFLTKYKNSTTRGLDRINSFDFYRKRKSIIKKVIEKCGKKDFSFTPYLEILISKKRGKAPRLISIATVRDRLILDALKNSLYHYFPERVDRKLPNNTIREIKQLKLDNDVMTNYIKSDIVSFFPTINQELLFEILEKRIKDEKIINLLKKAIKNPTVPPFYSKKSKQKYVSHIGIPQGLSISTILANIYLTEIDDFLNSNGFVFYRYVDDILIFTENAKPNQVFDEILQLFKKHHLDLHKEKTQICSIDIPFDFLGYQFKFSNMRGVQNGVSVRDSSIKGFIQKLANLFFEVKNNYKASGNLSTWLQNDKELIKQGFINRLNERITGIVSENKRYGWIFYFNEINDEKLLHKLDAIITGFFKRSEVFGSRPKEVKSFVKAFFEIKRNFRKTTYIKNYDLLNTIISQEQFLKDNGIFDPARNDYNPKEILIAFEKEKRKRLSANQLDVGNIS